MQWGRAWAWSVVVVATLATASPIVPALRGHKGDGFPLSWFPMFSRERPDLERPTYVVGDTADGGRVKVDVTFWATGGFNQGRNALVATIQKGGAKDLCAKVAKRVATRGRPEHADVTQIRIVRGTYDREVFFGGDRTPIRESLITECPVPR